MQQKIVEKSEKIDAEKGENFMHCYNFFSISPYSRHLQHFLFDIAPKLLYNYLYTLVNFYIFRDVAQFGRAL
ncbi:MAG: hypothetical protein KBS41_03940, partial [Oscillospiraceae bacterium]|nr:hypothetical protein [Candidatus Equicaccousia limihippi]